MSKKLIVLFSALAVGAVVAVAGVSALAKNPPVSNAASTTPAINTGHQFSGEEQGQDGSVQSAAAADPNETDGEQTGNH
jgi:hypothetical protein